MGEATIFEVCVCDVRGIVGLVTAIGTAGVELDVGVKNGVFFPARYVMGRMSSGR